MILEGLKQNSVAMLKMLDFRVLFRYSLGFACYRLYISVFFVINYVIPNSASAAGFLYDAYGLFLAVVVLAVAFAGFEKYFVSTRTAILGAFFMSLGAIFYFFETPFSSWLFVFFSGGGVALLTIQWGVALGERGEVVGPLAVIAGFFLAAVLNTGVELFKSLYEVACILAGPISAMLLLRPGSIQRPIATETANMDESMPTHQGVEGRYAIKASAAFCLFSIISVLCSLPVEISAIELSGSPEYMLPTMRACVTALVCFTALVCLLLPGLSIGAVYRLVIIFLVIAGLSVFLTDSAPYASYGCALIGRLGFQLVFWIFAPWICSQSERSSVVAFALQFGLYWLGYALTFAVLRLVLPQWRTASIDVVGGFVAVAIIALFVVYSFIFSEYDLRCSIAYFPDRLMRKVGVDENVDASLLADDRLAAIAEKYGLSPRETEVFQLLARGRDSSYVQKTLFVSPGTVSTHRQRIYRKLDVHSKQEMLDLVEREIGVN